LREIIRHSPGDLGYETSLWTLDLLAQACFEQGITATQVTGETIRATLAATGQAVHQRPRSVLYGQKSGETG
jgi:hypothetical protein